MSKRKPPKNLRPYATPSGKKVRMVPLRYGSERTKLVAAVDDIGAPHVYVSMKDGHSYVDADELRKWRASQTTSGENP